MEEEWVEELKVVEEDGMIWCLSFYSSSPSSSSSSSSSFFSPLYSDTHTRAVGSSSLSSECVLKIKYTQESHDSNSDANDDIVIVEEMEDKKSKCVMWNFRPKIQRKQVKDKEEEDTHREFLFVVDRSGSMSGAYVFVCFVSFSFSFSFSHIKYRCTYTCCSSCTFSLSSLSSFLFFFSSFV